MTYPRDLTDDQWELLEPVFNTPGKRGRKHARDLRTVVDAMLYIAQTGCQWRYLPESFGPWTRVWSQFVAGLATAPGRAPSRCCTRLPDMPTAGRRGLRR
jgi:transposase